MSELAKVGSSRQAMTGWWQSRRIKAVLLAGGIVAAVVYGLGDLASGLLYAGYSFRDQAISELTAFGSPVRPLMLTTMIIHSLLLLAFGVGLWRLSDRRSVRGISAVFIATSVAWLPNHLMWAMSSRWMEGGFNDTMHQVGSAAWVLLITVAIVLSVATSRGWFRVYAFGTLLIFLGFGAAAGFAIQGIDQNATAWAGGFERISAYAYFLWLAVLAIMTRRSLSDAAPEERLTEVAAMTRGRVALEGR